MGTNVFDKYILFNNFWTFQNSLYSISRNCFYVKISKFQRNNLEHSCFYFK